MKCWQITAREELELIEKTQPDDDENIKIRISKAALSSTDVAAYEGKKTNYPIVPVRAAVGLVSEAYEKFQLKKGERVVINPYNKEDDTRNKNNLPVPNVKVMGVDCDGLLCDFVSLPIDNVCILPEGVKDEEAIFVEQISLAIKAIDVLNVEKGNFIVILGANTLGNIIGQLALYYQIIPIIIDNDDSKLALAEKHGIYYTVNPAKCDIQQKVKEITGGKMAEYCIYEARSYMLPTYTTKLTQECGKIAIVGYNYYLDKLSMNLGDALKKQLTVICVGNGSGEICTAINLLTNKVIKTEGFIDKMIKFDDCPEIFNEITKNKYIYGKIVVDCL